MALPTPKLTGVHAVLTMANFVSPDPARDQVLISALKSEFPNPVHHQVVPSGAPPQTPYLVLSSSSAQLVMSAAQADFEVRFYGDYLDDFARGLEFVERKLHTIRAGLERAEMNVNSIGVISTFHFSGEEIDGLSPALHVQRNLLRTEIEDEDAIQDAVAKVSLRVRDTYYVNLTVSNYEERVLQRPLVPGMGPIRVNAWEGSVSDVGLELGLDINNNLEAQTKREDPTITDDGIHAIVALLKEVGERIGPEFAETGHLSVGALTESSRS